MNGNPHSGYANGSNAHNGYANQPHSPPSSHQQQRQSSLTSPRGHYGGHRSSHQGRDTQLQHMKASKSKLLLNLEKYKDKNLEDMGSGGGALADSGLAQTNLGLAQETVDLPDCKKELQFNQRDMEKQIDRDRDLMTKLSAEIRPAARRNFELEKNLLVLDKQIQLLIQNMISLAELNDMAGGVFTQPNSGASQLKSPLLGMLHCGNTTISIFFIFSIFSISDVILCNSWWFLVVFPKCTLLHRFPIDFPVIAIIS